MRRACQFLVAENNELNQFITELGAVDSEVRAVEPGKDRRYPLGKNYRPGDRIRAYVIDVNPTTLALTPGLEQTLYSTNNVYDHDISGDTDTGDEFIAIFRYLSGGNNLRCAIYSVSGTTVTESSSRRIVCTPSSPIW